MKKTIVGFLAAALFAPVAVFAAFDCGATGCTQAELTAIANQPNLGTENRIDALQKLVALLMAQIAQIKAAQNAPFEDPHNYPASTCFVPTYDLYIGRDDSQTNGEVKKLQLWLKAEGYFPDAQGTGYYGEKTAAAVMKWQKAHGMDFVTLTSGVGKQTRAKMQEKCSSNTTAAEAKYPYYLYHGGKIVYTSTESYSREQAISACKQRIASYGNDGGSSQCWWKTTIFLPTHEMLHEVKSTGADLTVQNVTITYPTRKAGELQKVLFDVTNIGNNNNAVSPSTFGYNVSIESVNANGSYTPLGSTIKGNAAVPLANGNVRIAVDIPASAINSLTGQTYSTFRAYIFVNAEKAVDEMQNNDANNATKSPVWIIQS